MPCASSARMSAAQLVADQADPPTCSTRTNCATVARSLRLTSAIGICRRIDPLPASSCRDGNTPSSPTMPEPTTGVQFFLPMRVRRFANSFCASSAIPSANHALPRLRRE